VLAELIFGIYQLSKLKSCRSSLAFLTQFIVGLLLICLCSRVLFVAIWLGREQNPSHCGWTSKSTSFWYFLNFFGTSDNWFASGVTGALMSDACQSFWNVTGSLEWKRKCVSFYGNTEIFDQTFAGLNGKATEITRDLKLFRKVPKGMQQYILNPKYGHTFLMHTFTHLNSEV